jgi:hypothetical protein
MKDGNLLRLVHGVGGVVSDRFYNQTVEFVGIRSMGCQRQIAEKIVDKKADYGHGTQTLIAGFDVTIGKVAGVIGDTSRLRHSP